MKSRAPSLHRHYPTSTVLLAPPTPRLPDSVFGCPYAQPSRPSPATSEISRVSQNNFPHIPSRRPRKVHLLLFGYLADGSGLPHLTTGSALSMTSYEALWVPWWYRLRVCDPSSKKVFSIHSVLKVASQNRIFASGVYRQFPAPDFNRLVALLPRHTVRSCILISPDPDCSIRCRNPCHHGPQNPRRAARDQSLDSRLGKIPSEPSRYSHQDRLLHRRRRARRRSAGGVRR
jgi:hypothetical protein